eukprot:gene11733-15664_t
MTPYFDVMDATAAEAPTGRGEALSAHGGASLSVLQTVFGYTAFRNAQAEIVDHVCADGDALVLMPTGGGKSLCYQLPSLLREGCGIVVSPLIALMRDQVAGLLEAGVKAAVLNSSLTWDEANDVERRLLAGELDVLYVAPERLLTPRCLSLLGSALVTALSATGIGRSAARAATLSSARLPRRPLSPAAIREDLALL